MLLRRPQIAIVVLVCFLATAGSAPSASPGLLSGSLIGFVSNQAGVPQMGAAVLLYNEYDRLVAKSLTNEKGAFGFDTLMPGVYSIRVTLASFVTALKDDVKIETGIRSFLSINLASVLSSIELIYTAPGQTHPHERRVGVGAALLFGKPSSSAYPAQHRHHGSIGKAWPNVARQQERVQSDPRTGESIHR